MRRVTGGVEREPDGTWVIAPDHLEQAAAFERRQAQATPVTVRTLSSLPLERQVGAEGATWLDRELVAETPEPVRDEGFGRDVRAARSEEHTSELQSLMRNSYAVFCLKNKTKTLLT